MPFFILIFGIAFGKAPVAILEISGSFQGVFWDHFAHLFADAAKAKNATISSEMLGLGGAGPPCLHYFC